MESTIVMNLIRRVLIALIIPFAFTATVSSQLRYGFRFGGEMAEASLKEADGYSLVNKSGFSGGLTLEYQMTGCGAAADIAVLYTRYNTRLRHPDASEASFGRNFIEIPLHLKYKFWLKSTSELVAPLIYTGPALMIRLDHGGSIPLSSNTFQPGWDIGIGIDIINFIQITGGYRFAIDNSIKNFSGNPDATLHTNGWNIAASILFDF